MKNPFVEIVIIYKQADDFVMESILNCLKMDYDNYRILLLPDFETTSPIKDKKIKVMATGSVPIPNKRNKGIEAASRDADYIAYIDSDAYPDTNWLKNAIPYFEDNQIAAIGGPNITPINESYLRKISGFVYKQFLGFGPGANRHNLKTPTHFNSELPTCNLIIRKSYLEKHPFDENYFTNEDSKLCSDIHKNKFKILFAKDVIVYHHRRKIFIPLIKQMYYYGYYKTHLMLAGILSSFAFLLPLFFLLFVITGIPLSIIYPAYRYFFLLSSITYFIMLTLSTLRCTLNPLNVFLTVFSMFLVHLSYGFGFITALLKVIFGMTSRTIQVPVNK